MGLSDTNQNDELFVFYFRVIKYVPKTNKIEVLMDGLSFPNGVQLSKDQNFLLVCELNLARILK